jgi:hypothetical protein
VPLYVLKTFNQSGRLIGRVEFRCGADDEAMAALLYLNEERSSELWCGSRHVMTWRGPMTGMTSGRDAAEEPKRRPGRPPRSRTPEAA